MDPVIDESNEAPAFRALNLSVMPVWAAMILAPRSLAPHRPAAAEEVGR